MNVAFITNQMDVPDMEKANDVVRIPLLLSEIHYVREKNGILFRMADGMAGQ